LEGHEQGLTFQSYGETFEQLCPYYMSIGMSYDEFWNGDVHMVKAYRKAYELSRRRQNELLWMQGLYVRDALISTVGNMFAGKGSAKQHYPEKPYPITEDQVAEQRERERKAKEERMKAQFASFVESVKNRIG
jgi:hypothetical protein